MGGILQMLLAAKGVAGPFVEIVTFNGSATWECPTGVTSIEYLIVAGGGGGGTGNALGGDRSAGGGGAGGFRTNTALSSLLVLHTPSLLAREEMVATLMEFLVLLVAILLFQVRLHLQQ
jgi:hypothetical protein